MTARRVRRYGDAGLLVETPSNGEALALCAALAASGLAVRARPGLRSVLVEPAAGRRPAADLGALARAVGRAARRGTRRRRRGRCSSCPWSTTVRTSPEVAARTGLDVAEVVARHAAPEYTVACLGFTRRVRLPRGARPGPAPAPAGLAPGTRPRRLGRRSRGTRPASTRARRPAAGTCSAARRPSVFDEAADPPALLAPGDRVRFVPVDRVTGTRPQVIDPGPLTLVQDLGRPGREQWGVAPSGAFDRGAHALAQRLVGNDARRRRPRGAARRPAARRAPGTSSSPWPAPPCRVTAAGAREGPGVALRLRSGERARPRAGPRRSAARMSPCAAASAVPAVLGSRSRDTGGRHRAARRSPPGDVLPVGTRRQPAATGSLARAGALALARFEGPRVVELAPGPHDDLERADPRAAGRWAPTATGSACGWWAGPVLRGCPGACRASRCCRAACR